MENSSSRRNIILSMVFAVGAVVAGSSYSQESSETHAQDIPETNAHQSTEPVKVVQRSDLPSGVVNFYRPNDAYDYCTFIDGSTNSSEDVLDKADSLRTTLERFPIGQSVVRDLDSSKTTLCFEDGPIPGSNGLSRDAEYRFDQDMMRFGILDAGDAVHEWKHKHDSIDFNTFHYTPETASLLLRFTECGAFAYEVMADNEAAKYGVQLSPVDESSIKMQMDERFKRALADGESEEQAWRDSFEECYDHGLMNVFSGSVISAYEQAINISRYRRDPEFGSKDVSEEFLMQVALPPGWDISVFEETGDANIYGNINYTRYSRDQYERLEDLREELSNIPIPD